MQSGEPRSGPEVDQNRIFGVLFLITLVTSIPALALYQPVLDDSAGYIAGGGEDTQIYLGALRPGPSPREAEPNPAGAEGEQSRGTRQGSRALDLRLPAPSRRS